MSDMISANALIYGATGGLGRAIIMELIKEGVTVYAIGRSRQKLDKLSADFSLNRDHVYCVNSLTNDKDFNKTRQWISSLNVKFKVGIHAAGKGLMKPASKLSLPEWQEVIDVNLTSAFTFYKLFSENHVPENYEMVYFSSASLNREWPKNSLYGASKAGLEAFCHSVQQEIKSEGGRIWLYRAGSIRTGFFDRVKSHLPMEKMLAPEQVASIIVNNLKYQPGIYFPMIPIVSE